MHASLINPNLKTAAVSDLSLKDSKKATAASPKHSFQHALTHARKPAKSEEPRAKIEKPRSGKSIKAKQSNAAGITVEQRKKADKASADDSEDGDTGDTLGDPKEEHSAAEDETVSAEADKSAGEDGVEGSKAASDSADISSTAHAADSSAQSTTKLPSTAQAAKANANGAQSTPIAGRNPAAFTASAQSPAAVHALRSKGDETGGTAASEGKQAAVGITDAQSTSHDLRTTTAQPAQKNAQTDSATAAATATAVGGDSSTDDDSSDAEIDSSPAAPVASAPTQSNPVGDSKTGDSSAAVAVVGQSSFASALQTLAGDSVSQPSPISGQIGTSSARAAVNTPNPGEKFIAENHPSIVGSVKTQLLPTGGTMRLRLDPPELGAMQVSVHVKDGVVTASFETSNDQATKMLSHSLGQLKQALESQGVTVGKIHVQQSAKSETTGDSSSDAESDSGQSKENTSSSQQDEQRRETLRRMWERLSLGGDPLDLVA
jgi:flagellar hook-length control protein FliK